MAKPLRTPPELLAALRALVTADGGGAVIAALGSELARLRSLEPDPPEKWTLATALEVLVNDPYGSSLFGAVRLLQGAQPDKSALGYSRVAGDEAVRVDQTLLLGFAPSEVDAVKPMDDDRPRLSQSAVGLLGPNGALPYRWTEHAYDLALHTEYRSQRDVSFHAWINVVQRRQLGLLYRAWSDAQAITGLDHPTQPHPVADRLRALAGMQLGGLRERDDVADGFKMAFAAVLSRRVRSPGPLASMLAFYFQTDVRIDEFALRWLEIPVDQRSHLGGRFATLGGDAVVGSRVWDATTRFRILIGPLDLATYRRFLPSGPAYAELRDLVSLYLGSEYEWDLVPILATAEVPYSSTGNPGLFLGWTSWLGYRLDDLDADDLVLPMAPRLTARATSTPRTTPIDDDAVHPAH